MIKALNKVGREGSFVGLIKGTNDKLVILKKQKKEKKMDVPKTYVIT